MSCGSSLTTRLDFMKLAFSACFGVRMLFRLVCGLIVVLAEGCLKSVFGLRQVQGAGFS